MSFGEIVKCRVCFVLVAPDSRVMIMEYCESLRPVQKWSILKRCVEYLHQLSPKSGKSRLKIVVFAVFASCKNESYHLDYLENADTYTRTRRRKRIVWPSSTA